MLSSAKTYFSYGLSVIPVDASKVPIGKWKPNTEQLIAPEAQDGFKQGVYGIGIVGCGRRKKNRMRQPNKGMSTKLRME